MRMMLSHVSAQRAMQRTSPVDHRPVVACVPVRLGQLTWVKFTTRMFQMMPFSGGALHALMNPLGKCQQNRTVVQDSVRCHWTSLIDALGKFRL